MLDMESMDPSWLQIFAACMLEDGALAWLVEVAKLYVSMEVHGAQSETTGK